jgi:hypothetical protein
MAEEVLVIRMESDAAKEHAEQLAKLEKRLESHGVARWAGTMDMGGMDFVVWLDVEVFDTSDLPERVSDVEAHVAEVGLAGVARVEIPEDADDDDWDDDDDGIVVVGPEGTNDRSSDGRPGDQRPTEEPPGHGRPDDELPDEDPDDEPDEFPDEYPDEEPEYPDDLPDEDPDVVDLEDPDVEFPDEEVE